MTNFLKRLVIRFIDYAIRVLMSRVAQIQAPSETASQETKPPAHPLLQAAESTGLCLRKVLVRPYSYPAAQDSKPTETDEPKYFLITSQGLAASGWLASSLNLHPDITCSMGIDHPLVSMRFYYNDDLIAQKTDGISDVGEIRNGFYSASLRERFKEKFAADGIKLDAELVRANPVRELQKIYDELEWFEKSKFYGNVHAYFANDALEYLKAVPARRDITLANLIRHPIPRTDAAIRALMSVATLAQDSDWHDGIADGVNAIADTQVEKRHEIEQRFGVDFTEVRNRAALYSYYKAIHNDCWVGEIASVSTACHVPIERLMSERDYYAWFVSEITQQEIVASSDYLDNVFNDKHLQSGRHVGKGRSAGPREYYQGWSEWERYEFKQAMERLDAVNVYAPFGYDFSFVK